MTASFTLHPDAVDLVSASNKDAILELLAARFSVIYNLDEELVLERLQEREKLGSTGFGRGVALPHARIPDMVRPVVVALSLAEPVEFAAADGMPVGLVFGLLSPETSGVTHLYALAELSRLVRDEDMRDSMAQAANAETLFSMIANVTDRDAA